ncbi:ATP-dependent DNA ligase [Aeromicrobium chenweiae]|uniref:ATP-dependent DNA ligase n=2 Tax=Aeromicrobium chenweiae TaxID=2079793 RepID=A0A2S0WIE7_9ACTN|nr:ATP-dependent DNA ligase [Aeromicrobium chenweiae]TGN32022.1 ATP-dependent DNA ligase [Aeromicrobium chenweiae]
MLARHVSALPEQGALPGGCAYEPKFDGYRALLFVDDDGCRVQSRRGHDITDAFDDVAAAATEQLPAGLVVDGELVVWSDGSLDFGELQRRLGRGSNHGFRRRPASFVAFDVLAVAGIDIRSRTLAVRRELLETVLDDPDGAIQLSPQTTDVEQAREWLEDYVAADVGIEGLVVKGLGTTYRGGARDWLKYRVRDTAEAVVGAVAGPPEAPEHLVLGRLDESGELQMVGTTTQLSPQLRSGLDGLLDQADDTHPWRDGGATGTRWGRGDQRPVTLVAPTLVVEVSVDSSTDRGRWRHPARLVRPRPDLSLGEIPRA